MARLMRYLVVALLGISAVAMATEELAVIYNGESQLPQSLVMGDWGYFPRKDTANAYKPERLGRRTYGLRILTAGRYQGARFDLKEPIDLTPILEKKNVYLELYLAAVPEDKGSTTETGTAGTPSTTAPTTPPPVDGPGVPPPGTDQPYDDTTLPAEFRADFDADKRTLPLPTLKNIRFTFFTEKGQGLLVVTPDKFHPMDEIDRQWIRVDIPMTMLNKDLPIDGKLTRMLITSDEPAQFLIGRMALVQDTTPLSVKASVFPAFLEAGKRIFFMARVETGLSFYETTWDFDTRAGDSVDAVGDRVTYTFSQEGNYLITCTVRDINGGKDPVKSTIEVKVSRAFDGG